MTTTIYRKDAYDLDESVPDHRVSDLAPEARLSDLAPEAHHVCDRAPAARHDRAPAARHVSDLLP